MNKSDQQFIPDGEWQGYYTYSSNDVKHKMNCFFTFKGGIITGGGSDDIGYYSWNGNYDEDLNMLMIKDYSTHTVEYTGYADENGIWGNWQIFYTTGGFHLWPMKPDNEIAEAKEQETEKTSVLNF